MWFRPRPPPVNDVAPRQWMDSVSSMPIVPLEINPQIYDMANLPLQRPLTLSCPLPIKLMAQSPNFDEEILKKEAAQMVADLKNQAKFTPGYFAEADPTSVWGPGKFSKMPYIMLPRLQELLEAKKFMLVDDEKKGDQSIDDKMDGTREKDAKKVRKKFI